MEPTTVSELLHWSYANLAMAHASVTRGALKYGRPDWIVRSRLYKRLRLGTMHIGPLADDERLKMILPQSCCYCGASGNLAADHLIPRKRGGPEAGDNLVWACRPCNSSKHAADVLVWLKKRNQFPPLLLLRRYLKLALQISTDRGCLDIMLDREPDLPFVLAAIPTWFPPPGALRLWVNALDSTLNTYHQPKAPSALLVETGGAGDAG